MLAPPRSLAPPGPSTGFAAVYEATFGVAWRTLARLGVPDGSLDDACQEVFLVVHRRLGDFLGRSQLKTWVVGIATRVAADHRRAARRKPAPQPLDAALPDPARSPLEHASVAQERALVQRLLAELPDEQREVLVLTEMEQLTAPEISEALEVNLNTVYSRLRLARRAFDVVLARWRAGAPR
jgi:RNA polymerase sigma-70 factor (ECF subfamily)